MRPTVGRLTSLLLVLGLGSSSSSSRAQWPASGEAVTQGGHNGSPKSLMLLDGVGAVWVSDRRGLSAVGLQRLMSADGSIAAGFAFGEYAAFGADPSAAPAENLALLIDASGGCWHASYSNAGNTPPSNYTIALEHFSSAAVHSPAGSPGIWRPGTFGGSPGSSAPAMAPDDSGGVYLAGGLGSLRITRVRADGSTVPGWPASGLNVGTADNLVSMTPRLAPDDQHGAIVVWQSFDAIRASHVGPDGHVDPAWPAGGLRLNAGSTVDILATWAKLVRSDATHWIAAWQDGPGTTPLRLARFGLDGTIDPAWPAGGLVVTPSSSAAEPSAVPDGSGGVFVLWVESGAPRLTRVLSNGSHPAEFSSPIVPIDGAAVFPATGSARCAGSSGGRLIVAWDDTRLSQPGVRARGLLADGTADPQWPDTGFVGLTSNAGYALAAITSDGAGGAYVDWTTFVSWTNDLWIQHFAPTAITAVGTSPRPRSLALVAAPNPTRGSLTLSFSLPVAQPARVQLLDLTGRAVRVAEVSGAGPHAMPLTGLHDLAPGIYVARVVQGAQAGSARITILR